MYLDIADLQAFYASPLGRTSSALIRRRLKEAWPDLERHRTIGIGFAPPLLRGLGHPAALMPSRQGVSHWPNGRPTGTVPVRIIRPCIRVNRYEILDYLKKRSIAHVVDESNSDYRYLRNRVRHQLIPLIDVGEDITNTCCDLQYRYLLFR